LEFNTLVLRLGPEDKIYKTMFFSGKATFEITSFILNSFVQPGLAVPPLGADLTLRPRRKTPV
jgi:hypothetical protein